MANGEKVGYALFSQEQVDKQRKLFVDCLAAYDANQTSENYKAINAAKIALDYMLDENAKASAD